MSTTLTIARIIYNRESSERPLPALGSRTPDHPRKGKENGADIVAHVTEAP